MLINIDGGNGSYLDVNMGYDDEFQPMRCSDVAACGDIKASTDITAAIVLPPTIKNLTIYREPSEDCYGYSNSGERIESSCWDWCAVKIILDAYMAQGMTEAEADSAFWGNIMSYKYGGYYDSLGDFGTPDERFAEGDPSGALSELRTEYLEHLGFTEEPSSADPNNEVDACSDINCASKPKYTADMCSIGASSGSYPYYIDKEGVFSGYYDDQNDILSIHDLQGIYDTLVSDGDISALSFGSFDEWLQANVDKGLLSGCWMSDAQRCDMPAEFGGYYPDEDYGEDEFEDDIYRVIFPNFDEAAAAESLLDAEGIWYDWGDGDRMLLRRDGLSLLAGSDIDFDEV